MPYTYRELVNKELDRLVEQGILTPVSFADWAVPIVPVLKSDKRTVRICGDFKQTVNQVSKVDKYPIPKIEDIFFWRKIIYHTRYESSIPTIVT